MPKAAVAEPRGHDLVEDEERPGLGCRSAEEAQEGRVAGYGAAGAEHGLDEDGGEGVWGLGGEEGAGGGDVVVRGEEEVVGEVEGPGRFGVGRVGAGGKGEGAAVVGAAEDEDTVAAGVGDGGGEGASVGLGAGVGEADGFDGRGEALADEPGQLFLVGVSAAEVPAAVEGRGDGGVDDRVVVAVDAGGVFAEEVGVGVAVEGGEGAGGARGEGQGEGGGVEGCARVAAGEVLAGVVVGAEGARVAEGVVGEVRCEGGSEWGGGGAGFAGWV